MNSFFQSSNAKDYFLCTSKLAILIGFKIEIEAFHLVINKFKNI